MHSDSAVVPGSRRATRQADAVAAVEADAVAAAEADAVADTDADVDGPGGAGR